MRTRVLPPMTRRLLLGAVVGGGALAACQSEGPAPAPGGPQGTGTPSPVTVESADRVLVRRALEATTALLAALATPPLARIRGVAALQRMHQAHAQALADALGETAPETAPGTSPQAPPRSRRELLVRETGHQSELVTAAMQAGDGGVARLLAVLAASVAQHLAVLPAPGPPARGPDGGAPATGTGT